ncbi:MAG: sulfurtransferase TusA family protein [Candidatus Omnitrophota bacterium]
MRETVDARGFLCPQPLMMLVKKMKEIPNGSFDILINDETAKENVCRTITGRGGKIGGIVNAGEYYRISVLSGE